jgi:acyl-CoA dehydrogenase
MDFNIPEEMKMIQTLAREFVQERLIPLEREVLGRDSDLAGAQRNLPVEKEAELVNIIKDMGIWGLSIPEDLGGAGLGVLGTCLVEEELAKTVLPVDFGDITPILFECNEEQKEEYLLPLIERKKTACLALIEPGKGIDPASLEMRAQKESGDYILNGRKIAFTKSGKADFVIVFAVTNANKGLREGVTCFLVDSDNTGMIMSGGKTGNGWQAQVGEPVTVAFENCRVPESKILGEAGKAFQLGKKWLTARRVVRGARCVGAAVRLLDKATEHAKSWSNFGQVVSGWPGIQMELAEMAIEIHSARLMVYQAACKADEGQDIHIEAAIVKVYSTEMLKRVADRAVLIKGGPGPVQGLPLEFLCQSLLSQNIRQRALEVQKSIIAGDIIKMGRIL